MHMPLCAHLCTYETHTHTHIHTHLITPKHTQTHTHTHTCLHIHTNTLTHTHARTHVHTLHTTQVPDCTLASLRALYGMVTSVPDQLTPLLARATDAFDTSAGVDAHTIPHLTACTSECGHVFWNYVKQFVKPTLSSFQLCWHIHRSARSSVPYTAFSTAH